MKMPVPEISVAQPMLMRLINSYMHYEYYTLGGFGLLTWPLAIQWRGRGLISGQRHFNFSMSMVRMSYGGETLQSLSRETLHPSPKYFSMLFEFYILQTLILGTPCG